VIVAGDESTGTTAEIERIIGQYHENTQRAALPVLDEVSVVATLCDLGVPAPQIAKRTKMPKPKIAAAQKIAGSELATAATARYDFLTLEQAATLADFEDDPASAPRLPSDFCACSIAATASAKNSSSSAGSFSRSRVTTITGIISSQRLITGVRPVSRALKRMIFTRRPSASASPASTASKACCATNPGLILGTSTSVAMPPVSVERGRDRRPGLYRAAGRRT
jgi:hypothetical protein